MVIIETEIFTRLIQEILKDEEYNLLQAYLLRRPDAGALIPGGKGLRKLRWAASGKGKRGGMRLIYFYIAQEDQIYMIYPFRKSDQEDLTHEQLKILAQYVKGGVL